MRVGVIGSGMAGDATADRLPERDHQGRMGSRTHHGPAAQASQRAGTQLPS